VTRPSGAERARAETLVEALKDPACYPHDTGRISLAETHISWVFLTGTYAYKVKKPVKLPFLDFSTLRRRAHFCAEELRLNRRLAPELYIDVVPIGGSARRPRIGATPAIEYAVKMLQFAPGERLDKSLEAGDVPDDAFAAFGARLADFHGTLAPVGDARRGAELASAEENFDELVSFVTQRTKPDIATLRRWTGAQGERLASTFSARARDGAYRECHGDLHLENLLYHGGKVVAYDALEFDAALRNVDVASEIAFLAMDLLAHGRADLAHLFLSSYFETGGEYSALDVLRFYLVYRALVRAKVRAIKAQQKHRRISRQDDYLSTALGLIRPERPLLVVTHGLSGSGKTFVTDRLIGALPALRVRSDLERKRLMGLSAGARTGSAVGQGIYTASMSQRTYERLAGIAERALHQGFSIIVDATFLKRREREWFGQVAAAADARFAILDCAAPPRELRRRIRARSEARQDASEATLDVLEQQLASEEPLSPSERRASVRVDTTRRPSPESLARALATL